MAKRRRKKSGLEGMYGIVGVGAKAPVVMAMGAGMTSQIQATVSHPAAAPTAITGVAYTGLMGAVGTRFIDKALKKAKGA